MTPRTSPQRLRVMLNWYTTHVYRSLEGPDRPPFYVDGARVGGFAVDAKALARGDEAALFGLFVTLTMYQSRRDVDIMAKQLAMPRRQAAALTQPQRLARALAVHRCACIADAATFDTGCDVRRDFERGVATCTVRPRTPCHVKDATQAIARMGHMGKLPTSAWLHLREAGGLHALLDDVCAADVSPAARADAMVARLANIFHVGTKLATFYVSALCTPALAPGLTPWFPRLDGNHLVVVDANVRRVVERLKPGGPQTYRAHEAWLRRQASQLDLREFDATWPAYAPRVLQQALYWYGSRANREVMGLDCDGHEQTEWCVPGLCPYHRSR